MNNKKGFTLVELMVTIIIMTSILLLAIVSVNKISDRQKEKAFDQTKKQIITAAKEYFSDNEYFINSMATSVEEKAYISLGTLVKLDYINVVTDPRNGQKLHECSYVLLTKDGYSYDETKIKEGSCVMDEPEIGEPVLKTQNNQPETTTIPRTTVSDDEEEIIKINKKFTVKLYEKNQTSCSAKTNQTEKETFTFDENNKSKTSKWYNYANGIYLKIEDIDTYDPYNQNHYAFKDNNPCVTTDGEIVKTIVDSDGVEYYLTVKLDRVPPVITVNVSNTNWTNASAVDVTITLKDTLSKLNFERRYWNKSGLNQSNADSSIYSWNNSSISYPSGDSEDTSSKKIYSKSEYTHTEQYKSEGFRKGKVKACDIAGNCAFSNEYYIKLDRGIPTVTVNLEKCNYVNNKYEDCETYKAGSWTNKRFRAHMSSSDSLSGINTTCYATSGNTTRYVCEDNLSNASSRTVSIHAQGVSYIRFAVKDNAGNWYKSDTGSTLYTVKIDRTAPVITSFANTKNKSCKTTTGLTCYYSHYMNLEDKPGKNSDTNVASSVSGLSGSYKYNHCYDNASADGASGLICESGFTSTGSNKTKVLYPGGYANRSYTGSQAVQHYTYQYYTANKYYNLFYKIYDKAGNYRCYRYKLHYDNSNKYTTAVPTYVASEVSCK